MTATDVPRHCPLSSGGKILQLRTANLEPLNQQDLVVSAGPYSPIHLFFGVGLIVVNTGVVSSMSLVIFFVVISGSSGSDGNGGGDDDDVGDGDNLH